MCRFKNLALGVALAISLVSCTPAPPTLTPVPIVFQEVAVTISGDPACPLDGLLTLPEGVKSPPVVLLVHGSGPGDMDATIGTAGNKPFRDLAQGLASLGIATLRYDKRTLQYPQTFSATHEVTMEQEVLDDAYAALDLLRGDGRIDPSRIYLLGHSMGGMLVPKMATDHPDLAGAISMAGSLRHLWEIIYDQNQALADTLRPTLSETDLATLATQLAQVESDYAVLRQGIALLPPTQLLLGLPAGYWRSLDACYGPNFLPALTLPLLVLQGDADFQVYPHKDYPLWLAAAEENPAIECHLFPTLNHLMMPTNGLTNTEDYNTPNQVDPQVITTIAHFINP